MPLLTRLTIAAALTIGFALPVMATEEEPVPAVEPAGLNPGLASTLTLMCSPIPMGVSAGYFYIGEPGLAVRNGLLQYGSIIGGGAAGGLVGLGVGALAVGLGVHNLYTPPPRGWEGNAMGGYFLPAAVLGVLGAVAADVAFIAWSAHDVRRLADDKNAGITSD